MPPTVARGSRNPDLEAAIVADPDNAQAYAVYADWLESQGDPRGELIALQRTKKHEKKAKALLTKHEDYFLGALATHRDAFTWANGFIYEARIPNDGDLLAELLAHPSGQFLNELSLIPADDMASVFEVLAEQPRPTIRVLTIYKTDTEVEHVDVGDLGAIWKALPNLTRFWIHVSGFTLGKIDAPHLTALEIGTDGLSKANVKSLVNVAAPNLERLDIDFGEPDRGGKGTANDVAPLLRRTDLPKLRHLGLRSAPFADELVALLATSKLLRQLATLAFSQGAMTDKGAAVLAKHADAFAHLDELDLDENYLTDEGQELVQDIAKSVSTDFQKDDEGEDSRYVGSWE